MLFEAELRSLRRKCRINTDHQYPSTDNVAYQPPHSYLPVATPQTYQEMLLPKMGVLLLITAPLNMT
jgi:hypothetical protein